MKLLYLSCHAILEYDELKIFEELGVNYFSLGSYIDPQNPVDPIRPALSRIPDPTVLATAPLREKLTKDFIDRFDIIMIMHVPEWIEANWEVIKHKRVIWRTIGQSTGAVERRLKKYRDEGMEIIRYSPREDQIPDYLGADAVIRFYKDPAEFGRFSGMNREAITFAQNMIQRGEYCHFNLFQEIVSGLPAHVYGPKNEEAGELNGGFLTYEAMQQKMAESRVYIYTGTQPASYTLNFIEAWMTGIPIVAVGPKMFNSLNLSGDIYEIPDLIEDGVNGFVSDDMNYLRSTTQRLMDNKEEAKIIGQRGAQRAVELFGKEVIKSQWKKVLGM